MSSNRLRHFTIAGAVVFVLWLSWFFISLVTLDDWAKRGQLGDLFGAINALFSGLAFAAFFVTILLQRDELSLQREELRLQREEMAKQREMMGEQARAQQNQCAAAIATIRVASIEAMIEVQKMDAEAFAPSGRQRNSLAIGKYAAEIKAIAEALEQSTYRSPPPS